MAGESSIFVEIIDGGDDGWAIKIYTLDTYLCNSGTVN